ncbi:DUF6221 family protein [Catenuloplanes indicus]|uniref:Uncharacterized protein n=1 Tax=Catenuloplanes indicus TaxID=137267 RepID=A0AAE4B1M3_9ACTN|nr:DUF6221 family protein [Catenuloplanes indicus]MDQ0371595.1 hypothetical protein [Catenuloplanes indicus]
MTGELVAWLRAQLDADLTALNAWNAACIHLEACGDTSQFTERFDLDGERWRADLNAKLRILDAVERHADPHPGQPCTNDDNPYVECELHVAATGRVDPYAAQLLALPYADRDGYRDEWRPA